MEDRKMGVISNKVKIAPCQEACPAGVDVPRYIRYIKAGKFDLALAVIRESIPFATVCAYACPHPCELKCARRQFDEPVAIRMLKRAAVENAIEAPKPKNEPPTGKKVAIVGSGPSGLTTAYYLAGKGHMVTVFESRPLPGGMMRYCIPNFRLPNELIDRDISLIVERGVEIKTGVPIESADKLLTEGYDAVCAATGAWAASRTGMGLGEGTRVIDGIVFLEQANADGHQLSHNRVVVVGGGNTAVDSARSALRLGAQEVTLVYRRGRDEMPANPEEVQDAQAEGVKFEFLSAPVKTTGTGVICAKMRRDGENTDGRPRLVLVEQSEFYLNCNLLIEAVGQSAQAAVLGIPANSNGTARVDDHTMSTLKPGIFAAGDLVTGPSTIIQSISQGRLAAAAIDEFLGGEGNIGETLTDGSDPYCGEYAPMGTQRPAFKKLIQFGTIIECGYGTDQATFETGRCLGCDIHNHEAYVNVSNCKECGYCKEVCKLGVFKESTTFNCSGYKPMAVVQTEKCVGCLRCLMICPDLAISVS